MRSSRITVYDVMDYYKHAWSPQRIADLFKLTVAEVEAAIRYIEAHKAEVMVEYQKMLDRDAQGNQPEIQARLDATRGAARRMLGRLRLAREAQDQGANRARFAGRQ